MRHNSKQRKKKSKQITKAGSLSKEINESKGGIYRTLSNKSAFRCCSLRCSERHSRGDPSGAADTGEKGQSLEAFQSGPDVSIFMICCSQEEGVEVGIENQNMQMMLQWCSESKPEGFNLETLRSWQEIDDANTANSGFWLAKREQNSADFFCFDCFDFT